MLIGKFSAGFPVNTPSSNVDIFQIAPDHASRESAELQDTGVVEEVLRFLDPHLHEGEVSETPPDFRKGLRLALIGSACFWLLAGLLIRSVI